MKEALHNAIVRSVNDKRTYDEAIFREFLKQPIQTGVEHMNDHFTKVHLHGLPVGAVLHRFTAADGPEAEPHDHPWPFTSFIISGGYEEDVFQLDGSCITYVRHPGVIVRNEAGTIHRIVRLLAPECWTLVLPGEHERTPGFYRFEEDGAYHRFWNGDWKKL